MPRPDERSVGQGPAVLPRLPYSILTPYLLPPDSPKKVNIGDGFILDSAQKLIGGPAEFVLSSRKPIEPEEIERINATRLLLCAGANSLRDDFAPAPGFDQVTLEKIKVPIVLFGVGHFGTAEATRGLGKPAIALIEAIAARFPYIAVRCHGSKRYLDAALPHHAGRILMTSCPVAHSVDEIDREFARKPLYDHLVVTVTDRVEADKQAALLPIAAKLLPARTRSLALHQDFGHRDLWKAAENGGFGIVRSDDYRDFLNLYWQSDVHFGNRVHAHLKCLSLGVVSFLCPFDLRQVLFAESLDTPLMGPRSLSAIEDYDFSRARRRIAESADAMRVVLAAIRALLPKADGGEHPVQ